MGNQREIVKQEAASTHGHEATRETSDFPEKETVTLGGGHQMWVVVLF